MSWTDGEEYMFCGVCGICDIAELDDYECESWRCESVGNDKVGVRHYMPEGVNSDHYLLCKKCYSRARKKEEEMNTFNCAQHGRYVDYAGDGCPECPKSCNFCGERFFGFSDYCSSACEENEIAQYRDYLLSEELD